MSRHAVAWKLPLVLLLLVATSVHARQRLPFEAESLVRFAPTNAAAAGQWEYGTVLAGTRRDVLVRMETGETDVVRFAPNLRLQVQRGRNSAFLLGGALGFVAGAVAGVAVGPDLFGENRLSSSQGSVQGAIVLGAGGAVAGALIASQFGGARWREVDLSLGYIPAAPRVADNAGDFSLRRMRNRWTRFEPTVADFRSYFAAHREIGRAHV